MLLEVIGVAWMARSTLAADVPESSPIAAEAVLGLTSSRAAGGAPENRLPRLESLDFNSVSLVVAPRKGMKIARPQAQTVHLGAPQSF